jgi:hypothetical protein
MGEITDDATHASTQTEGCGSQELQFSNACIDRSIPARQVRQMKKKGGHDHSLFRVYDAQRQIDSSP